MLQLSYTNYTKFENGKLKTLVLRIAFSFGRAEKIAKNSAMCFVRCKRRIAIQCRFYVHPLLDIPRLAKLREKRLRPSEQEVGGIEVEVARETRSKMGLELQISLFSVSPFYLSSLTDLSPLLYRPSALTSEHVRGTYRRACFKESLLDDKSSDFPGFKFVTTKLRRECVTRISYHSSTSKGFFKIHFLSLN